MRKLLLTATAGAGLAYLADPVRRDRLRSQATSLFESSDDVVARITRQRDEAVAAAQEELRANRADAGRG